MSVPDVIEKHHVEEEPFVAHLDKLDIYDGAPAATSVSPLTLDFLAWIASAPRCYAEAMEAWRTSCPRFTIWEDAIADGLIRVERGNGVPMSQTMVVLTPRGRALLIDV